MGVSSSFVWAKTSKMNLPLTSQLDQGKQTIFFDFVIAAVTWCFLLKRFVLSFYQLLLCCDNHWFCFAKFAHEDQDSANFSEKITVLQFFC